MNERIRWLLFCLMIATIFYVYQAQTHVLDEEKATLIALNETYELDLKAQHQNLKECMSKLPQKEVDDFYRRHREEFANKWTRMIVLENPKLLESNQTDEKPKSQSSTILENWKARLRSISQGWK